MLRPNIDRFNCLIASYKVKIVEGASRSLVKVKEMASKVRNDYYFDNDESNSPIRQYLEMMEDEGYILLGATRPPEKKASYYHFLDLSNSAIDVEQSMPAYFDLFLPENDRAPELQLKIDELTTDVHILTQSINHLLERTSVPVGVPYEHYPILPKDPPDRLDIIC